jgi:hypothetical protein
MKGMESKISQRTEFRKSSAGFCLARHIFQKAAALVNLLLRLNLPTHDQNEAIFACPRWEKKNK